MQTETPPAKTVIKLHLKTHDGQERMFAEFPYHRELVARIKSIPGARSMSLS